MCKPILCLLAISDSLSAVHGLLAPTSSTSTIKFVVKPTGLRTTRQWALHRKRTQVQSDLLYTSKGCPKATPLARGTVGRGGGGSPSILSMASRLVRTYDRHDFAGDSSSSDWPFADSDMSRGDEAEDSDFYAAPRLQRHLDEWALFSLRSFYRGEIDAVAAAASSSSSPPGDDVGGGDGGDTERTVVLDVLDLCSSWASHLPTEPRCPRLRVAGVGMNAEELEANLQLDSWHTQDLNRNPCLRGRFDDESFDLVLNACSVDYLTDPREVFRETHRVLRPGGVALVSFSDRCFPSKAVRAWLDSDDAGRMGIVASYFHHSESWNSIEALDVKLQPSVETIGKFVQKPDSVMRWFALAVFRGTFKTDPIYVVKAVK